MIPRSAITGIGWPAMPAPVGASMLAMQFQLEQSQWWKPEALRRQQLRQLEAVLAHAAATVPFYASRLERAGFRPGSGISSEAWRSLPLLSRSEIQSAGNALHSRQVPPDHGSVLRYESSGSTGEPIVTYGTEVTQFFWGALTLRDHLWHRRDLSGTLAAIRTKVKEEALPGWGPSTDVVVDTGPSVTLNISTEIDAQLRWLQEQNPDYLLTHPSNALALARRSLEIGAKIPRLREVRSFGETLPVELRATCRQAWGVPVTDMYSAEEVGYIALQCPECEHYHLQAENLLVEVLDEEGMPCEPGQVGRVVITTLHNFAMPLVRYANGDYAEAGGDCACGRGLPVLNRIMGRQRNMVTLPGGRQHWPSFPSESWLGIAPIRQIQLIQRSVEQVEARLVLPRDLTADEESRLVTALQEHLGHPFRIAITRLEQIPRAANFKYEDFVSEVPAPGA